LEPGRCLSDRQITGYMPPERQTVAEELRSEYTLGYVSNNALRSCLEEVERLSRLTEELLVLAHLDAERETGAGAPAVPLSPIVDDALRRLEVPAARRAVKLVLESGPEPLAVRANPGAVSLALRNVLDNAVEVLPARRPGHHRRAPRGLGGGGARLRRGPRA
jgi:signal transduction histidine kinase